MEKGHSTTNEPGNVQPISATLLLDQLIEMWHINNRINIMLINDITDEGLNTTLSKKGGRTVALQFLHMHNVRIGWLEHLAKDIFRKYKLLDKEHPVDKKMLLKAFEESGKAIEELIRKSYNEGGHIKSFKKGLIPYLGYLVTHDAHHRGSILLTLKQSGYKLDDKMKWQIWEWDKI